MMMKKYLLPLMLTATVTMASDLYTDTYMSGSGVVSPHISTGIANPISGESLLKKRILMSRSIYFDRNGLTEDSQNAFEEILSAIQSRGGAYYVSIIGHTSSFTDEYHFVKMNAWSRFWQNIGKSEMRRDELAATVNQRIQKVYDKLSNENVNTSRIYTENRMNRDPIVTEETKEGSIINKRVDVTVYY